MTDVSMTQWLGVLDNIVLMCVVRLSKGTQTFILMMLLVTL